MIGLLYLKIKRNWLGYFQLFILNLKRPYILNRIKYKKREYNCIISLTTIISRNKIIEYTILSILNGTLLPEAIVLYVDEKVYTSLLEKNKLINKLIDLNFLALRAVEDVRSYTKLVYALDEFAHYKIVICDDDVLYPKYWLKELVQEYNQWNRKENKTIICHRAHKVELEDNIIKPYNSWEKEILNTHPSRVTFPTGTGGVLYPPNSMPEITKNKELFLKLAPTSDDVWFWFCAILADNKFLTTERQFRKRDFQETPDSQDVSLFSQNVHNGGNDQNIKKCFEYFKKMYPKFNIVE